LELIESRIQIYEKKMIISRRKFVISSVAATGIILSQNMLNGENTPNKPDNEKNTQLSQTNNIIKPAALSEGSTVAIAAPASHTSLAAVQKGVKFFKNKGCKIIFGETIKNRKLNERYLSASDEYRKEEFMNFIQNDDVNCIFTARGGTGTLRILDLLDYDSIRKHPKIVLGFSDITALLTAITRKTGIVTYHGPVASSEFSTEQKKSLSDTLFDDCKIPIEYKAKSAIVINTGKAEGILVGGNLSMFVSLLGTPYEPDTEGSILFLEETREEPYKIDRMLNQLMLAGKLQKANALVFGYFKNLNTRRNFYPGISFTVKQIIEQIAEKLPIPVVLGMPIGHHDENITLPLGIRAVLDTSSKTLSIIEKPVA
jgi:muramoyltetrapeptide carboxypeptidase